MLGYTGRTKGRCWTLTKSNNPFIENDHNIFALGRETNPVAEQMIDTDNPTPISVPLYWKTPTNKEKLEIELNNLLQGGYTEACTIHNTSILFYSKNGRINQCYMKTIHDSLWHTKQTWPLVKPSGTFRYLVIPFGLRNTLATF